MSSMIDLLFCTDVLIHIIGDKSYISMNNPESNDEMHTISITHNNIINEYI